MTMESHHSALSHAIPYLPILILSEQPWHFLVFGRISSNSSGMRVSLHDGKTVIKIRNCILLPSAEAKSLLSRGRSIPLSMLSLLEKAKMVILVQTGIGSDFQAYCSTLSQLNSLDNGTANKDE